jgi:protein phosphatase
MKIEVFGNTDVGKKRELNEDDYVCLDLSAKMLNSWTPFFLLAVADGVGGHAGGAVASSLAISTLKESVLQQLQNRGAEADFQEMLQEAFRLANARIYEKASQDEYLTGMGTTLVVALVAGQRAVVANVGDSRAYHIRRNAVRQVSYDHSWVAEQLKAKALPEHDIFNSPFKHMITRSLGFETEIKVDTFLLDLKAEDYLLLCTDGLYSALTAKQLLKIIKKMKDPEKVCQRLIFLAREGEASDNMTGIVARLREVKDDKKLALSKTVKLKSF